jgi:PhoH-like ATPase
MRKDDDRSGKDSATREGHKPAMSPRQPAGSERSSPSSARKGHSPGGGGGRLKSIPQASALPPEPPLSPGAAAGLTHPTPAPRIPQIEATASVKDDKSIKHFVIDTNVLLHDPDALFVFQEHEVVIPFTVIEELDKFKREPGDIGRAARECIRNLDNLRQMGRLAEGVRWAAAAPHPPTGSNGASKKTGVVRIDADDHDRPAMLSSEHPDNRIIAVAWHLHHQGVPTVFVSKDLNARIKADALGLRTEDFENAKVDADRLYTGFMNLDVPGDLIDRLYADRMLPLGELTDHLTDFSAAGEPYQRQIFANQFLVLKDQNDENHHGLARRLADTDHLIPVTGPRKPVFGILARNVQQTMALDLLMDDEVRLVTLLGSAGTGKTLVAVAAGMAKVFNEQRYDKLLVARPIMPMGRDIGYLPGTKDDKLGAWMQPIFDNLSYLLSTRGASLEKAGRDHGQHAESQSTEQRIRKLVDSGQLVLEPLTYIRGRSIPHQFMIVDEAQNLTPHEIKTIVSRVGEGTKVILTGDIGQIDQPYLDSSSNGLSYVIEKMKGLRIVGHVTLGKSERSELASLAASLL